MLTVFTRLACTEPRSWRSSPDSFCESAKKHLNRFQVRKRWLFSVSVRLCLWARLYSVYFVYVGCHLASVSIHFLRTLYSLPLRDLNNQLKFQFRSVQLCTNRIRMRAWMGMTNKLPTDEGWGDCQYLKRQFQPFGITFDWLDFIHIQYARYVQLYIDFSRSDHSIPEHTLTRSQPLLANVTNFGRFSIIRL